MRLGVVERRVDSHDKQELAVALVIVGAILALVSTIIYVWRLPL